MNRVLKASVAQVVKTGNAELISQLSGTSSQIPRSRGREFSGFDPGFAPPEATLQPQLSRTHPNLRCLSKLIHKRASLKGVQQSLQEEIGRIAERSQNDFEVASKASKAPGRNMR